VERTVSNQNEVQQATTSIVSECDAIYIPTDNIYSASMPLVEEITVAAKVPVFTGENGMAESGGFASLGLTYYDLGYQAGLMAVEILKNGADISKMPVTGASSFEYYINGRVAQALGIEIPAEYEQYVVTPAA
jgi:putative ABC transport system substrate-binding protein